MRIGTFILVLLVVAVLTWAVATMINRDNECRAAGGEFVYRVGCIDKDSFIEL